MEAIIASLILDQIPESWLQLGYPCLYNLTSWTLDLQLRHKALSAWVAEFQVFNRTAFTKIDLN